MVQNGRYRGGIYSLPFNDTSVTVLWYNPNILKAAGITHPPRTWAELAADCPKVTKGGTWCFDTTDNEEPLWEAMVLQWGGKLVNSAGTKAAFDTPAGIGALQFWIPLVKMGYVHHTNSSTSQWAQDFGSGHVAFEAYSSAGAHSVLSAIGNKFTLGAAPLPAGPVSNVVGNAGDNLFMFSGAAPAVKQAAWLYIRWVTSPRWTAWWAEQVHTTPVRKSAVPLMAGFTKTDPTEKVAIGELSRAYFSPTVSGWAQAQGDVDTEMTKAMLGEKTAAQAIQDVAREVDHDIATAP
jgi:ABC-type glycerol-3-phosphate transport system substrate-binding protein